MRKPQAHGARRLADKVQRPLLAGALVASTLAAPPALGAFDMFLKLQGIDGESLDSKHGKEIDVVAYSFGSFAHGSATNEPAPGGLPICAPLVIHKLLDRASPKLMEAAITAVPIPTGTLTVRRAGQAAADFYVVTMSTVLVSSLAQSGDESGTGIAERITLSPGAYNISYRPQDAKTGQLGTPIVFATNCGAIGAPDRRN